jgi:hypothetical protein
VVKSGSKRPVARWKSALLIAVCAAGIVVATPLRVVPLRWAGHTLVRADPLVRADIAIVPQWTGAAGALEVADLIQAGMVDRVAVLASPVMPEEREFRRRGIRYDDEAAHLMQQMISLGLKQPERLPTPVAGTEAEGQELADWCQANPVREMMIISPPDHSRRLRRVLRRSMGRCTAHVSVRTTRYANFEPDHWFETRWGLRIGVIELQKLLLDVARHPFS